MKKIYFALVLSLLLISQGYSESEKKESFRVVAYAPIWTIGNIDETALSQISDLIIFSAELSEAGDFPESPIPAEALAWYKGAQEKYKFRLHLCFGGWGRSGGFSSMTLSEAKRSKFIADLARYCVENGIQGIDYDWEFPENPAEKNAYDDLLVETRQAATPKTLEVSVALGWTQKLSERAIQAVDHIHLMTYDMGKRHSTYKSMDKVVRRLINNGVAEEKIVVGVPFYGRSMDNQDVTASYSTLQKQYNLAFHENEAGGFYFNGLEMIRRKTHYALEHGLGGIMIWELSADEQGDKSLLNAIKVEIRNHRVQQFSAPSKLKEH